MYTERMITSRFVSAIIAGAMWCAWVPAFASQAYVSLAGQGGSVSQFSYSGGAASAIYATPKGAVDLLLSAGGAKLYVGTSNIAQGDVTGGSPAVIAVLNPATGAISHQYKMPGSVVKMVLNAAGDHIFATGVAGGKSTLMSLDLTTGATAQAVLSGAAAGNLYTLAISPNGSMVYVPVTNEIDIFNAATLASAGSITLAHNSIAAPPAVTPDGSTLLAVGRSSVYVVNLTTGTLQTTIPIKHSAACFGSVISPDGTTFYVSAGTLSAIDVASLTVTGSVALGETNPFRLGISPDGTTLFATDITYGSVAVVDTATLTVQDTIATIAPPNAVAVTGSGVLVLNENSTGLSLVDTASLTVTAGFLAGDGPLAAAYAAGKLFIPEAGSLGVQETPAAPGLAKPLADRSILAPTVATLGGSLYVNSGITTEVFNPVSEKLTGAFNIHPNGGTVTALAASGDGISLLATYQAEDDGAVIDSGLVKVDTVSGTQLVSSSYPFVPGAVASSPDGTRAYAVGSPLGNTSQVGVWDTQNGNVFLSAGTIAGNPSYVGLAVSADGSTLYLVDANGKVDFVNASTLVVIVSLAVGTHPSGISLSADGEQALITDSTSTSVTVLDLANQSVVGTVSVGAPSAGSVFLN